MCVRSGLRTQPAARSMKAAYQGLLATLTLCVCLQQEVMAHAASPTGASSSARENGDMTDDEREVLVPDFPGVQVRLTLSIVIVCEYVDCSRVFAHGVDLRTV